MWTNQPVPISEWQCDSNIPSLKTLVGYRQLTTRFLEHLKWRWVRQKVAIYLKVKNTIWTNQKTELFVNATSAHMQHLTKLLPHILSEHQTSFHAMLIKVGCQLLPGDRCKFHSLAIHFYSLQLGQQASLQVVQQGIKLTATDMHQHQLGYT